MKTNYLPRSKPRKSGGMWRRLFAAAAVLVAGAVLVTALNSYMPASFSPAWALRDRFVKGFSSSTLWLRSKDSLARENAHLRERILSQEAELASLREKEEREAMLLSMLGRNERSGGVLASVLVRPPQTPYDILVIDAGSEDGVALGYKASMPEGPALGEVVEVSARSSKVMLYTSGGQKTNAVLERHGVPVILSGQGGGNFKLTLPREIAVEEGDRILTPDILADLLGVVGAVKMSPTDSHKEVMASGAANIFSIRHVIVSP